MICKLFIFEVEMEGVYLEREEEGLEGMKRGETVVECNVWKDNLFKIPILLENFSV